MIFKIDYDPENNKFALYDHDHMILYIERDFSETGPLDTEAQCLAFALAVRRGLT